MSFAMPLALFREMEGNLKGSLVEGDTWKRLLKMRR